MPLSINSPIEEHHIYNAVELARGHPVFKLEGYGDNGVLDNIVVKQEAGTQMNVTTANALMNIIDPRARQEVLTNAEVAAIRAFVSFGGLGDIRQLPALPAIRYALNKPGAWVKMEIKQLTSIESAVNNRMTGDKADVRLISEALRRPGGLEGLGAIIAADLFNGNNDRFVYPPPGKQLDNLPVRFKTIWNEGNVLVACDAQGTNRPIGLDSFDPSTNNTMPHNQAVDLNDWPGKLLVANQVAQRASFAADVIFDLELALGPRNRKNPFKKRTRLGKNRKNRVLTGIQTGTDRMRDVLVNKRDVQHIALPLSITSRMIHMGW